MTESVTQKDDIASNVVERHGFLKTPFQSSLGFRIGSGACERRIQRCREGTDAVAPSRVVFRHLDLERLCTSTNQHVCHRKEKFSRRQRKSAAQRLQQP